MRVLYFGSYDRSPGRNTVVMTALEAAGVEVSEHHALVWPDTEAKVSATRRRGLLGAALRQSLAWDRLARSTTAAADVVIAGSTAHLDLWLARREARRRRVPLVFDPLVSIVETIRDRELWRSRRALRLAARAEGKLFGMADIVLADSMVHARAWAAELGIPTERFRVVPAGAPIEYRKIRDYVPHRDRLRVAYFGQFIPLHGVDVMLDAAARLTSLPIDFVLAGRGQMLAGAIERSRKLGLPNVEFQTGWRSPADLSSEVVAGADICLGAFADLAKTDRVVPFKVYTALAAGRCVITADTAAARELLRHDEVRTVPPGDPEALAAAIRELAADPATRARLAEGGRAAFDRRFAPAPIGATMVNVLEEAIRERARHTAGVAALAA